MGSGGYVRVTVKPEAWLCLRRAKLLLAHEFKTSRVTNSDVITYLYRKVFGEGHA